MFGKQLEVGGAVPQRRASPSRNVGPAVGYRVYGNSDTQ